MAFRALLDGLRDGNLVGNDWENRWNPLDYDVNDSGGMFGEAGKSQFVWYSALMRGGMPLDNVKAQAQYNEINNEGFDPVESIMNHPEESGPWDTYNINIINYYKDDFSVVPSIKYTAFPPSMGVYIESSGGLPAANAEISLYGVTITGGTVNPGTIILSGQADANGVFEFPKNPYLNDTLNHFDYNNILVSAISGQDTAFAWIPFYDPSNAWFAKSDTIFRKVITMP